jgi:hypothetical protein
VGRPAGYHLDVDLSDLTFGRYLVLIPDCAVSEMPFISVMAETSRLPQALR